MIGTPVARAAVIEPVESSVSLAQYCATLGLKVRHAAGLGWCAQLRGTAIVVTACPSPLQAILDLLRLRSLSLLALVLLGAACGRPFEPKPCLRWAPDDTVTAKPILVVVRGQCLERAE